MPPEIALLLAVLLYMPLHLTLMAVCARAFGVKVREISIGSGPLLLQTGIVSIRAILLTGYVKLKDTREERGEGDDVKPAPDAYDCQPTWIRAVIPLSGCFFVLAFALGVYEDGWRSFGAAFAQIFLGAFSPLSVAQEYLREGAVFAANNNFILLFALVATKLSACNLLPLPHMNGGQALMALRQPRQTEAQPKWILWLILPGLLLPLSWIGSYVVFIWHAVAGG
ncbi:site-2 protease family protein [Hahella sp. HN01]|uniref:site-2 protease family protein n=1 Tax=Hahella sp. HN01 TaxID=2847262 RepID=UPI001C1F0C46|nr:site-2 protease family protein [Hahella sp. HN01]MBU6952240.1 site-2 protease family protein [Hahella sp. HN01]